MSEIAAKSPSNAVDSPSSYQQPVEKPNLLTDDESCEIGENWDKATLHEKLAWYNTLVSRSLGIPRNYVKELLGIANHFATSAPEQKPEQPVELSVALHKAFPKQNAGEIIDYLNGVLEGKYPMPSELILPLRESCSHHWVGGGSDTFKSIHCGKCGSAHPDNWGQTYKGKLPGNPRKQGR